MTTSAKRKLPHRSVIQDELWLKPVEIHGNLSLIAKYMNRGAKEWRFTKVLFIFPLQFSSVIQSCLTLCRTMNCSMPGLPVHHQLPEFTQTHVYWVSDAIQTSHPLSSPSSPALNLSQHQDLFKWVSSSHQVAKVLEFQLQHQSYKSTPRTDLL